MEYPLLLWKIYMHYWVYKWNPVKRKKNCDVEEYKYVH